MHTTRSGLTTGPWRKSSYSNESGGDCVEVAACPGTVHVRDSKDVAGPQLAFPSHAWVTFLGAASREA